MDPQHWQTTNSTMEEKKSHSLPDIPTSSLWCAVVLAHRRTSSTAVAKTPETVFFTLCCLCRRPIPFFSTSNLWESTADNQVEEREL
jgi:hypothetical protein